MRGFHSITSIPLHSCQQLYRLSMSELDDAYRAVQALELKKSHLLKEANEVDLELRHAKAKHGRLLNRMNAHIFKLPNEILSHIFMECQRTPGRKVMPVSFEILVSHVSSMFRQIAVGTPLLWTAIVVKVRPRQPVARKILEWKLERVRVYLERSASCPFTTTFDILGPFEFQVEQILDLISKHASRWLRLSISMRNPPATTLEIWQALHMLCVPALEHVSILLSKLPVAGNHLTDGSESIDNTPLIFREGAPSLKFVRLSGIALGCLQPPLELVETLHLSSCSLNYSSFHSILSGIPNLLNLSLHRIHIIDRPTDCAPIQLTQLISLRLCGNLSDEARQTHRILRKLNTPALESLVLKGLDAFDEQVFPTVHTLTLHQCPFSAGEMFRMLRAFPALTTFRLDESLPDVLDLLGMPDTAGKPPWPKLHTLAVTDMEPADVALLCDMVSRRQTMGTPLSCVLLDRRSRVVLRKKNQLEWLQKTPGLQVDRHDGVYSWPVGLEYEDHDEGFWDADFPREF
ncbi:F-box domain-containing protein [Favolaschia claudopus]|uniref:F-box domain-containing protein n=1 Tax=Favolaschia claudopus TaxID=2862362 RepID=A0AAW0C0S0_9AGAR